MKKHNTLEIVLVIVAALVCVISAITLKKFDAVKVFFVTVPAIALLIWSIYKTRNVKNNVIVAILLTLVTFGLLSWLLPAASFQYEVVEQGRSQLGLFDLFNYPSVVFQYFGYIPLYIITVGGFYGVLYKIPAYHTLIEKIAEKSKKNGLIFIIIIMILFAFFTSICGSQITLLLFFPFIASIILSMGYDKIVVALTLVGSTMVGIIGSTFGNENVGYVNGYLATEISANIYLKFAILISSLALLILNTIMYIKKNNVITKNEKIAEPKMVEENEEVSKVEITEKEEKEIKQVNKQNNKKKNNKSTSKSKSKNNNKAAVTDSEVIVCDNKECDCCCGSLIPTEKECGSGKASKSTEIILFVGMILMFVLTIFAFIPYSTSFKSEVMTNATTAVQEYKVFGFPIFSKLLGNFNSFGEWIATDLFLPMALLLAIVAFISKVKFADIVDGFVSGAKKAMVPAIIGILAYVCLVSNVFHPFQLTIYQLVCGFTKGFNIFTASITAFLSGIFNADSIYSVQSSLLYVQSLADAESYPVIAVIYPAMYGLSMLIAPTSLILMATLSYLGVSYKDWLKNIVKLFIELFVVLIVFFLLITIL